MPKVEIGEGKIIKGFTHKTYMYSYIWFACQATGGGCVETIDEAKEKFSFDKKVFGAYRFEVRLRQTNELIYKG